MVTKKGGCGGGGRGLVNVWRWGVGVLGPFMITDLPKRILGHGDAKLCTLISKESKI